MSGQTPGEGPGDTPVSPEAPDERASSSVPSEPSPGAAPLDPGPTAAPPARAEGSATSSSYSSTPIWDQLYDEMPPEVQEVLP